MTANGFDDDKTRSFTNLAAGTLVLHYKIISKIGAGGMGEVYLAQDTELDRKVALKFLPPHLCQDEDCRKRFKREAQAAAKLSHPNIIHVYEVSEYQGRPFFAMEHVEGRSLRDVNAEELDIDRIVGIAIQLCDGLHKAHASGVIHRDIKPSNIIIDSSGRPKLLDFGLATVKGSEHLTKTGSTLGTVGYMSPEQIDGKATDARSDLFSLGVVLYELIANKSPFRRGDETATLKSILQDTPEPLARYKSGIPDDLQRIITKLLEKDPSLRYQAASGVIPDLKRIASESTSTIGIKKRQNQWNRYGVPLATAVLLAVLAIWYLGDHGRKSLETSDKIRLAVLPFENLGDPADEFFADGITEEITSRLAKLSALGVISRSSAILDKKTEKPPRQIAKELDVEYILEGTIRWDKSGAVSRVRITPQLIKTADNTHVWAENYEREMNSIFDVQVEIASNIASVLDLSLIESERDALAARPTDNIDAYQAYLKGLSLSWEADYTAQNMQTAVKLMERAVELDPEFVEAYAALAVAHADLYHFSVDRSDQRLEQAREAVDRALALDAHNSDAIVAEGTYLYVQRDHDKAGERFEAALKLSPDNEKALWSLAATYRRLGRFDDAIRTFQRYLVTAPQSAFGWLDLGFTYEYSHHLDEADSCYDRAIAMAPDQTRAYEAKAVLHMLNFGDLATASRVLYSSPPIQPQDKFQRLWQLDLLERNYEGALNLLSAIDKDLIDDQVDLRPSVLYAAICYDLIGDTIRAQVAYDSARLVLEPLRGKVPDAFRLHTALGFVYAGLGEIEAAICEADSALADMPLKRDALLGGYVLRDRAYIYTRVGEYESAIEMLEHLMFIPHRGFGLGALRLDPRLDPLRDHPRFQALLEKYEKENGI